MHLEQKEVVVVVVVVVAVDVAVTVVCIHRVEAWRGRREEPGAGGQVVGDTVLPFSFHLPLPLLPCLPTYADSQAS